jgi:DHA2 family multidrug resistance protein
MTSIATQRGASPSAPTNDGKAGAPASHDDATDLNMRFRWIILIGLITASVMEVLDTTIITVALPQMAGNLNATTDEIAWVSTGYILSNVIVLPMTSWLSQRFGRKQYLCFSILLFIISSFFCGASKTLGEVVFWRIMQGAGGAALLSTAQATLQQIFPKKEQTMVQTLFILGIVVAPTLGPAVGGVITDNYDWPWCFFINVPIGLASFALVYFFLHDTQPPNKTSTIDYIGMLLLTAGLGSMQYVLEEGERDDWFDSVAIQRLTALAVVSLIALVVWELSPRNKHPVINLRILKNVSFTAGLILFLAVGFGLYGAVFIFPLFTQDILGFSPTATGLVLMPGGFATAVSAMLSGFLMSNPKLKVDPRVLVTIGFLLFIWSMWNLGHLSISSGEPDTRLALIIRGFGMGFIFNPINNAIFASLKGPDIPQGSAFVNLARQLGGSFGIAALNTYIVDQMNFHRSNLVTNIASASTDLYTRQHSFTAVLVNNSYSHANAKIAALGMIDHQLQAQAAVMAYNDGFLLLGVFFVVAMPAILLLRRKRGDVAAPAH